MKKIQFKIKISIELKPNRVVFARIENILQSQKSQYNQQLVFYIKYFLKNILTPAECRAYILHLIKVLPHIILTNGLATTF